MKKIILKKIIKKINECNDLISALQFICNTLVSEHEGYDWVGFYLHDQKKRELNLSAFAGPETEHKNIKFGKGICGHTAESNKPYISRDVSKESNYISCNILVKSEIVVPIFNGNKVNIGQIDIDSNNYNQFSKKDLIFLEKINLRLSKKFFK